MVNELTRESFVISRSKSSLLARGMLSVLLSDANSDGITASFGFWAIVVIFYWVSWRFLPLRSAIFSVNARL